MAQRSSGIFPREGFNLDDSNKVEGAAGTSNDVLCGGVLSHCKTIRVIAYAGAEDLTITLGEGADAPAVVAPAGSAPYIAHVRGALITEAAAVDGVVPNTSINLAAASTSAGAKVYFEKLD